MPRGVKKENLPTKICVVCNRPFTWRKKWEKVWDEVTTCSKSCNRKRRAAGPRGDESDEHDDDEGAAAQGDGRQCGDDWNAIESLAVVFGNMARDDECAARPSVAAAPIIFDNNSNTTLKSLAIVAALAGSADAFTSTLSSATHRTSSSCATTGNNVGLTKELGAPFVGVNAYIDGITISEEMGVCLHGTIAWRTFDEEYLSDDDTFSQTGTVADMDDTKARRKAEKKRKKAARRAQREGTGNPAIGRKPCTLCGKSVDLLVRCTHTASGEWAMVCGKCWKDVSGGVVDGDVAHPYYRYGGLWKNRHRVQN